MNSKLKNIFYLFFPLLIGSIVSFIISGNINYQDLVKPPLAPPKILFPIVWSIIYLLMGISYFIFKRNNINSSYESKVYYVQLIINALWSIIFFLLEWRFIAILWIILLDILVIYMNYLFYKKVKISAYLNFLYIIWILFATYLTIGIYILN